MGITVQGNLIVKGDQLSDSAIKIVKNYGIEKEKKVPLTLELLKEKVDCIRNLITDGRLWFPICKYMMWEKLCVDGDFTDAVAKLQTIYPDVIFNTKDLSSLNNMSLSKPLAQWKFEDSQFKSETQFNKYKNIAVALYEL